MSMSIYARKGTKVRLDHPGSGYTHDVHKVAKYLTVGAIYTVESTQVHSSSTDVYLEEVPGISFNSVHFEEVG